MAQHLKIISTYYFFLGLYNLGSANLSRRPTSHSFLRSLGLYNGAVDDSMITCSQEAIINDYCTKCSHARYGVDYNDRNPALQGNYWCTTVGNPYYQISFEQLTYLKEIHIETLTIKDSKVDYSAEKVEISVTDSDPDDENFLNIVRSNQIVQVSPGGHLKVETLNKHVRHVRIYIHTRSLTVNTFHRFELYGWPHWSYARPLGVSSGYVSDSQITSYSSEGKTQYPQNARLDRDGEGWHPNPTSAQQTSEATTRFWLQFSFDTTKKFIYIMIQSENTDTLQANSYSVKYGVDSSNLIWYNGPDGNKKVVNPPKHNVANKKLIHVFSYTLVGKILRYYPYCGAGSITCSSVKIEIFGESKLTADHQWVQSYDDYVGLQYLSKSAINYDEYEITGIYSWWRKHSRKFPRDDCLVNPEKCLEGLTVSFWLKDLLAYNDASLFSITVTGDLISNAGPDTCQSFLTGDIDFDYPVAIFVKDVYLYQYQKIYDWRITCQCFKGNTGSSFLSAYVYITSNEDFVTNCQFQNSSLVPSVEQHEIIFIHNILSLGTAINSLINSPRWIYGSSIAIVLYPEDSSIVNFQMLKGDKNIVVTAVGNTVCDQHETSIIESLPVGNFYQKINGSCGGVASDAKHSKTGWKNCNGPTNYLKMDLGKVYQITMLKVAGCNTTEFNSLTSFYLKYTHYEDQTLMDYVKDSNGAPYKFERKEYGRIKEEYLPLPSPITAKWIQVEEVSYKGTYPCMRIDVVECQREAVSEKLEWLQLNEEAVCIGSKGNDPAIVVMPTSYDVRAVKLKYINGPGISCSSSITKTNFGCEDNGKIDIIVTTSENVESVIAPRTFVRDYDLYGYRDIDEEIIIPTVPVSLKKTEKIYVWIREDLFDLGDSDNEGYTCVQAFVWGVMTILKVPFYSRVQKAKFHFIKIQELTTNYLSLSQYINKCTLFWMNLQIKVYAKPILGSEEGKKSPGHFITLKSDEVESGILVTPCISINHHSELIFHRDCEDSFYINTEFCMIHLRSGRFVTKQSNSYKLTDECQDKFKVHDNGKIEDQDGGCFSSPTSTVDDWNMVIRNGTCLQFEFFNQATKEPTKADIEASKRKYHLAPGTMVVDEAKLYCANLGMKLPTFGSLQEFWVLKIYFSLYLKHINQIWLGFNRDNDKGEFKSEDGSPLLFDRFETDSMVKSYSCVKQNSWAWKIKTGDNNAVNVLCQEIETVEDDLVLTFMASGLHKTKGGALGTGFHIGVNVQNSERTFTLQTTTDFYQVTHPHGNQWTLFTMTWNKGGSLKLYVDGVEQAIDAGVGIPAVLSPGKLIIPTNFLVFLSDYDRNKEQVKHVVFRDMKFWRYVLSEEDISHLYSSSKQTFYEADSKADYGQPWKLKSTCSDKDNITGPCGDADSTNANSVPLKHSVPVYKSYTYNAVDLCIKETESALFPSTTSTQNTSLILLFKYVNVTNFARIRNAHLQFVANTSSVHTFTYYIYLSLHFGADCLTSIEGSEVDFAPLLQWNITAWDASETYLSVDISQLINVMIEKPNWQEGNDIIFVLTPAVGSSDDKTNIVNIMETQLIIYYESVEPSRYLYFPSKPISNEMNCEYVDFSSYHYNVKAISFWLNMNGPDVGILYVWQLTEAKVSLLFRAQGHQGMSWKQIWIEPDSRLIDGYIDRMMYLGRYKLRFEVFNNFGIKGHIAIDNIETTNNNASVIFTNYPQYDLEDRTSYMSTLVSLGLPQPRLLYPFSSNYLDYGPGRHDLIWWHDVDRKHTNFRTPDKFQHQNHALQVHARKNLLEASETGNSTDNFDEHFSIVLHIKASKAAYHPNIPVFYFGNISENAFIFGISGVYLQIRVVSFIDGEQVQYSFLGKSNVTEKFNSQWMYIGITYAYGIIKLYINNQLDGQYYINPIHSFPTKLSFFLDQNHYLQFKTNDWSLYSFSGRISCFRTYNETLTLQMLQVVEYCPNRLYNYPRLNCTKEGFTQIFKPLCVCFDYVKRYVSSSCENSFIDTLYTNSIVYMSYDIPEKLLGEKGRYNVKASDNVDFLPSPINNGVCVENNSVVIAEVVEDCLISFTGCVDGFVVAFWLKFSFENVTLVDEQIFGLSAIKFFVKLGEPELLNATVQLSIQNCDDITAKIGVNVWFHVIIGVPSNWNEVQLSINGVLFDTATCTNSPTMASAQALEIGGPLKVCIDEFSLTPIESNVNYQELLYQSIVYGNYSTDPNIMRNLVEISVELETKLSPLSSIDFHDVGSVASQEVIKAFQDMLMDELSINSRYFQGSRITKFIAFGSTYLRVNAILYFSYFGLEEERYFSTDYMKVIEYNGRKFYLYGHSWKPLFGIQDTNNFEIEVNSTIPYNSILEIKSVLPLEESYTYGYYIEVEKIPLSPLDLPFKKSFLYRSGRRSLSIHGVYPNRNFSGIFCAITHEGYGRRKNFTFLSAPDYNYVAPYNISASNTSHTSIKISWVFEVFHFNHPIVNFSLFYSEVTQNFSLHEDLTNYTVIVINQENRNFELTDLKPFTNYSFYLMSVNPVGDGPMTHFFCYTDEWLPEIAPVLSSVTHPSSVKANIEWLEPQHDIQKFNSWNLEGFEITVEPMFPATVYHKAVVNETFTYDILNYLTTTRDEFQLYKATLRVFNHVGFGPDNIFCFATTESTPNGELKVAEVVNVNSTSIKLRFGDMILMRENGIIIHYIVEYTSLSWNDVINHRYTPSLEHSNSSLLFWDKMKNMTMNCTEITENVPKSSLVTEFIIDQLFPASVYQFNITACTKKGCKPGYKKTHVGATVVHSTRPDLPSCFPNFTLYNVSSTAIRVDWKNFTEICVNGYILMFHVVILDSVKHADLIQQTNLTEADLPSAIVTTQAEHYVFEDLKVFWNYSVLIFMENQIGKGPLSHFQWTMTDESFPKSNLSVINITMSPDDIQRSFIHFIHPPFDIHMYNSWRLEGYTFVVEPFYLNFPYLHSSIEIQNITTNMTFIVTQKLDSFKLYRINAFVYNKIGYGPKTTFCFVTPEHIPSGVLHELDAINITSSAIQLRIGNMSIANESGVITHYMIEYIAAYMNGVKKAVNTSTIEHSAKEIMFWSKMTTPLVNCSDITSLPPQSSLVIEHKLENLHPYVTYEIDVFGCTIVGCKKEDDTAPGSLEVRTLPSPPSCAPHFQMGNQSSTEILLQWKYPTEIDICYNGDVTQYYVVLVDSNEFPDLVSNENNVTEEDLPVSVKATADIKYVYSDLKKYWNYSAAIFVENQISKGPISKFQWAMTAEDVPEGPPNNITLAAYNSTTIVGSMTIPDNEVVNGIILGYNLHLSNRLSEEIDADVLESDNLKLISGLRPNFLYKVKIRAFTSVGYGPYSDVYEVKLPEAVPSQPPNEFSIISSTNDSVSISWMDVDPLYINGMPQYFLISGYGELANGTNHSLEIHNVSYSDFVDTYKRDRTSLFPGTLYHFHIVACTRPGCGVSQEINVTTEEMEPIGFVNCSHIINNETNILLLKWMPVQPMEQRGVIVNYNIAFAQENEHNFQEVLLPGETTEYVIEGLANYTKYVVKISAFTKIGEGPMNVYVYQTNENVPSMAPQNIAAHNISSSAINVQFSFIPSTNYEGVLIGYKIFYQLAEELDNCSLYIGSYETCYHFNSYVTVNETTNIVDVPDLELNANYSVCVGGYTVVGDGPVSNCVFVVTDTYTNGNWTEWTSWMFCDQTCGNGTERRYHWCTNPVPANGGADCPGPANETRPCNDFPCPTFYLAEPNIDCNDTCSSISDEFSCSAKFNTRSSSSVFENAMDSTDYTKQSGISCNVNEETMLYTNAIDPVYSISDSLCKGFQKVPANFTCDATEELSLDLRRLCYCVDQETLGYLEWATWSPCTVTCGLGSKRRYRTCIMEEHLCKKIEDVVDCNTHVCPIDGMWGAWSNYSDCDRTCGFGNRIRRRHCNDPSPELGGKDCVGVDVDLIQGCNPYPCPVSGGWSSWLAIEDCTQPCNIGGTRTKRRYCDNPRPQYGGEGCPGERLHVTSCNEHIECEDIIVDFIVKLTEEEWDYKLVYSTTQEFKALSDKCESAVFETINSTHLYKFTANEFRKGSVIMNFTLSFLGVGGTDLISLQHAVDVLGYIQTIPVSMIGIDSNDVPLQIESGFVVTSNTPYSIDVSWLHLEVDKMNGKFYDYYVHYRLVENTTTPQWYIFGSRSNAVRIPDLIPGTLYGIRMAASNDLGRGIATLEKQVYTKEGEPYIAPPNFTHTFYGIDSTFFKWNNIPQSEVPGNLIGYFFKYRKYFDTEFTVIQIITTMTEKSLHKMKPYEFYWVEICGFTVAGCGPNSLLVFRTPEAAPEVAPVVTLHEYISPKMISLTWKAIPKDKQNGVLLGYQISYELLAQGGNDVVKSSQKEIVITTDRFTFNLDITGLEPYSTYRIKVFAFTNAGGGPVWSYEAHTCRCPENIYSSYYSLPPYTSSDYLQISGLFYDLIPGIVYDVCGVCNFVRPNLYFNATFTGHPPEKLLEKDVKVFVDENVQLSFPMYGRFSVPFFAGEYPYVGVVRKQGIAMIVYHEKVVTRGVLHILVSVASAWPMLLVALLLAATFGCAFWLAESTAGGDHDFSNHAFSGFLQGLWLAYITMTTVGYGDFTPKSDRAKAVMILWVFAGLVTMSIFYGSVSSNMTISNNEEDILLYGTETAALYKSAEYQLAVMRNAMISNDTQYTKILDVLDAVAKRKVVIGLLDAVTAAVHKQRINDMSLKIYKVLDIDSGYGIVLSGGMKYVAEDFRSNIRSRSHIIQKFVDEKTTVLSPDRMVSEIDLISKDEMVSFILTMSQALLALIVLGAGYEVYRKLRSKTSVSPVADAQNPLEFYAEMNGFVVDFKESFTENTQTLIRSHSNDLQELVRLKKSYVRFMDRFGEKTNQAKGDKKKKNQEYYQDLLEQKSRRLSKTSRK